MKPMVCLLFAAGLIWGLMPDKARAAQLLVVIEAYRAKDLEPGAQMRADQQIELTADARVSLLSESGRIIVLKGPYSGKADNRGLAASARNAETIMGKLSKLIMGHADTTSTGATRNIDEILTDKQAGLPHPSYMSVMSPGKRCALSKQPELWRADAATSQELTLKDEAGTSRRLTWPAGDQRIDLPEAMVANGKTISATLAGKTVELRLALRPKTLNGLAGTLAWMADEGCQQQAASLLNAMLRKASQN